MRIACVILILCFLGFLFFLNSREKLKGQVKSNTYLDLRNMALHSPREKIGIPAAVEKGGVWGFLMDWGVDNGTATVVAFADGSASIYLSSGGGYIGGQGEQPIREAAKNAVAIANECKSTARPTSSFPLPHKGEVIFYFLTDEGVLTASASVNELATSRHKLSRLGNAAQEIITQYRKLQSAN